MIEPSALRAAKAVNWTKSKSFVHVDEQGNLSPALTKQFLTIDC
jgi:hypothetical protein